MAYHRLPPDLRAERDARIAQLYEAGLEIYQLRDRFGLSSKHIIDILDRVGVNRRGLQTYDYLIYNG